ncbi:MAG TPA: DUF1499 domain-containing protein [Desulfobulbus sp.]|nr:DUF1499 domain-containing protein [Desulfobulbus sp.]HHD64206.1 DUF1499 domain-containing protein [Desulfobulbaceae bacterium]
MRRMAAFFILFAQLLFFDNGKAQIARPQGQTMNTEEYKIPAARHLDPCPDTPNCVNSEQRFGRASIAPFQVHGPPAVSWHILLRAIQEQGGQIESVNDMFLHATFRTGIFRFVDDLTCRLDPVSGVIHLRSSSRIGYFDFGTNRRRAERIRRTYRTLSGVDNSGSSEQ